MKKFQMLKAGDYILYAIEVSESTASVIEHETKHFSLCYGEQRFVTLESYLAYKGVSPMDIYYYMGQTVEENRVKLSYNTLTYSEVRTLKQIFGEDNIFIEGDRDHPGILTVICKLNLA